MSVLLQFSCLCRAEGLNAPPVFTYSAPPVRIKYKRLSYQMKLKICLVALALPVALCAPARQGDACRQFAPGEVKLLPSRFRDNFVRDSAWMMSVPVNSLLHSFRNTAGVYSGLEGGYDTVEKLGGWESLDCDLRGHVTGHIMSALAMLYAQTGSPAVKAKADSIVGGLAEVQRAYGTGYLSAFGQGLIDRNIQGKSVWAPWYTLHKLLQGLIDQYTLCHSDSALAVATRMGEWAYGKTHALDDATRRRMLRNEFGGFNDAMYQLYQITGDARFLETARFFYHNEKIDPLKAGNADLGTAHANTFIPKLLGECREYDISGSEDSRRAACLLFNTLSQEHAFVTGEVSDKEHLFNPAEQHRHLTGYDGENCCTFNLLKLAARVFSWSADKRAADYIERAIYNHILGQQDTQSGMVTYFTPLLTGAYRLYSTPRESFWCCVGSGFESHVGYASYIYFHNDTDLYVNLFIPSELRWGGTTVRQETDFPRQGTTVLTVGGETKEFAMHLRRPWWAASMTVRLNGKKVRAGENGAILKRKWREGDRVEVAYGMEMREEAVRGDSSRVALLYGPVVMAGCLGHVGKPFSDPSKHNDYYTFDYKVPAGLAGKTRIEGASCLKKNAPLDYTTPQGVRVKPFYDVHHERYVVYWNKTEKR